MPDERIDIYDEENNHIGTEMKSAAHQYALRHRSVHLWITDGDWQILLQQRSGSKDTFPNMWDISVAWHVGVGEPVTDALVREMQEELWLRSATIFLEMISRSVDRPHLDYYNREYTYVYIAVVDRDYSFIFSDGEVQAIQWFDLDHAKMIMSSQDSEYHGLDHSLEYERVVKYLHENHLT
jgi:isopentenyldiphosphate isomerase